MGANAQTSVPVFTSGQVLTAAQQTEINTGIPVFADSTARDAAFGGTGEKTLAEGQFAFLEDSDTTQYYDGATWQEVGVAPGLVLINTTTIGTAVSSVTVSGAFSATYENYKIVVTGGVGSTAGNLGLILGATTTNYYYGLQGANYSGSANTVGAANAASWLLAGNFTTDSINLNCEILQPNLTKITTLNGNYIGLQTSASANFFGGMLNNSTAYTAFTITPSTGTLTGGTIRVYGYQNS